MGVAAAAAGAPVSEALRWAADMVAISLWVLRSTIARPSRLCPSAGGERSVRASERTGAFWGVDNSERVPIKGESLRPGEKASQNFAPAPAPSS